MTGPTRRASKGDWTEEEDKLLALAVQKFNEKNWKKIAECVPNRTDVQCLHGGRKFLILILLKDLRPRRTENSIKKHGNCSMKKKKKNLYTTSGTVSSDPPKPPPHLSSSSNSTFDFAVPRDMHNKTSFVNCVGSGDSNPLKLGYGPLQGDDSTIFVKSTPVSFGTPNTHKI
ncbi:transcription factor MYB3R-2-like [Actinidia eriantha]|uniref:transcription factor MYB3R-2-like n=1 Tax=Actinidia eriantha TaxID=165200 RepID=UPI00258D50D1|nr:transcription factor MYB3R-2-like [Actinidia eriantha]XP_057497573.1 transcription factor MYB3R-2-like [Actinidia eriantha]